MTDDQIMYEAPTPVTEAQKKALARMFADNDIRGYIIHAIQVANQNSVKCLRARQPELAAQYSTRAETVENLLNMMKLWFIHFDKIEKKSTGVTKQA